MRGVAGSIVVAAAALLAAGFAHAIPPEATYVGEKTCIKCHDVEAKHFSHTVHAKAFQLHAGLLGIVAKPGKPVKFDPYTPATGQVIEVWVLWKDDKGQLKKARAQEWIKHARTEKEMPFDFVFAGSGVDTVTARPTLPSSTGMMVLTNMSPAMT
jgi:hypothetical protein